MNDEPAVQMPPGVVVLMYRFWTTTLGKDPSVIGKTIRLDFSNSRTVNSISLAQASVESRMLYSVFA